MRQRILTKGEVNERKSIHQSRKSDQIYKQSKQSVELLAARYFEPQDDGEFHNDSMHRYNALVSRPIPVGTTGNFCFSRHCVSAIRDQSRTSKQFAEKAG